jgi:peroxiredoxin
VGVQSRTASIGDEAPDFTLPDARDAGSADVTLSSYRGRPVVLAFLRGFA